MFGCLKMYMLCTGIGCLNPRLRHTADTEGDLVNDLQTTTDADIDALLLEPAYCRLTAFHTGEAVTSCMVSVTDTMHETC